MVFLEEKNVAFKCVLSKRIWADINRSSILTQIFRKILTKKRLRAEGKK